MCITSHLPASNFIFIILPNYLVWLSLAGVPCDSYWTEILGSLNNISPLFTSSYRWLINVFNNKNLLWCRSLGHSVINLTLHPQRDLTPILSGLFLVFLVPGLTSTSKATMMKFSYQCLEPEAWVGGCLIFHLHAKWQRRLTGRKGPGPSPSSCLFTCPQCSANCGRPFS